MLSTAASPSFSQTNKHNASSSVLFGNDGGIAAGSASEMKNNWRTGVPRSAGYSRFAGRVVRMRMRSKGRALSISSRASVSGKRQTREPRRWGYTCNLTLTSEDRQPRQPLLHSPAVLLVTALSVTTDLGRWSIHRSSSGWRWWRWMMVPLVEGVLILWRDVP